MNDNEIDELVAILFGGDDEQCTMLGIELEQDEN